MKIIEMYHRKYVFCDVFQNDSGYYVTRIAENYPDHLDFIEKENLWGRKCKYWFVRQGLLELGKEVILGKNRKEDVK